MQRVLLLFVLLTVAAGAMAAHKKKHITKAPNNAITSVTMHRTPCHGRCPEYTVKLAADGTVIYDGLRFTDDTGRYERHIGASAAAGILAQFAAYRIDTCRNLYRSHMADVPGFNFAIQYKDSVKNIINAHFGPGYCRRLQSALDSIGKKSGGAGWQKVAH